MGTRSKQKDSSILIPDVKHPGSKKRIGHQGGAHGSGPSWIWDPSGGFLVRVKSPRKQSIKDRKVKEKIEAVEREKKLHMNVDTKPYKTKKVSIIDRIFQRKGK